MSDHKGEQRVEAFGDSRMKRDWTLMPILLVVLVALLAFIKLSPPVSLSKSYGVGGRITAEEMDKDGDGFYETAKLMKDKDSEVSILLRPRDGAVYPLKKGDGFLMRALSGKGLDQFDVLVSEGDSPYQPVGKAFLEELLAEHKHALSPVRMVPGMQSLPEDEAGLDKAPQPRDVLSGGTTPRKD